MRERIRTLTAVTSLARGTAIASALAAVVTAVVAWPVLLAPGEQIFGHEIVGRHHDPFTVMRQIAGSGPSGPYLQPLTDGVGWLLARAVEPVQAYNLLVLSTFPLTAVATYVLARYLRASHAGALFAAMLFAFAPVHLAHAAYHPHIAQTQWLPLYVLALVAMVDRPSILRAVALAGASAALVLSNFYGGLIGAVVSPILLVAYWATSVRRPPVRHLWGAGATLAVLAAVGVGAVALAYPQLMTDVGAYAVPASDAALYSARWWAYGVPPVSHGVFGPAAADTFVRAGITIELLEQQVFVSYAAAALAMCAGVMAVGTWRDGRDRRSVVALLAMAVVAAVVSVGPPGGACTSDSWTPACRLHAVAPMFRAFARFAFVVHLGVALAAGLAVTWLAGRGRPARTLAACLMALACFEYWPLPARARDVLPTTAHRWLAREAPVTSHVLDCAARDLADAHLSWLMQRQVSFPGSDVTTCPDPYLGGTAAALGHTHVLVRRPDRAGVEALLDDARSGLAHVEAFDDAALYAVVTPAPPVVVLSSQGFYEYEHANGDVWRWMRERGRWRVRNTTDRPRHVRLIADLDAARESRPLTVSIDGAPAPPITIAMGRASYTLGHWMLTPGDHVVAFEAAGPPFRPSDDGRSSDDRRLTIAFRDVRWIEESDTSDTRAFDHVPAAAAQPN